VSARLTDDALGDIQGFITSGYGHLPLSRYLFLHIRDARPSQDWLASAIPTITTSSPWPMTPQHEKIKPASAVNLAFTADGLAALGLPPDVRCSFPVEFQEGMATPARSAVLGDTGESAPARWQFGGPAQLPVHAMLIVHGASLDDLVRECRAQRERLDAAAGGVAELQDAVQDGYRPDGGHEPFGFHDGIAQPAIRGVTGDGVPTGEFILGYPNHYDLVPPTPVVKDDLTGSALLPPLANPYYEGSQLRDLGRNGSYVVYRKLEQDVAGFWQFMKREAVRATGRDDTASMVWIASRCMGRWPSGAPLALSPDRDDPSMSRRDDFLYDDDVDGLACPVGAHVRRTNPRAVLKPYGVPPSLSMSEAHRLLRRGRVFGPPLVDPRILLDTTLSDGAAALANLADDGSPRGIHFLCVNASIRSQFEFVQQSWCNNPRFSGLTDNKDPIIGDNGRADRPSSHMMIPKGPHAFRTAALPRFVTVRGGAYLFMPSITALRFLSVFRA
jgi:Dyp-type peroxidase family